jgi:hypothetical protein
MIQLNLKECDCPNSLGLHEFHYNHLTLGGPQGITFGALTHSPIALTVLSEHLVEVAVQDSSLGLLLSEKKTGLKFKWRRGQELKWRGYTLILESAQLTSPQAFQEHLKKVSVTVLEHSAEATLLAKLHNLS